MGNLANHPAVVLVRLLFDHDDLIELRPIECWVDPETDKKASRPAGRRWVKAGRLWEQLAWLNELQRTERANIFFGVCPREKEGDGKKKDIRRVRVLWADLDECTQYEADRRVMTAGLPKPTAVVASGHGVHLYWLLSEPNVIEPGNASD